MHVAKLFFCVLKCPLCGLTCSHYWQSVKVEMQLTKDSAVEGFNNTLVGVVKWQ